MQILKYLGDMREVSRQKSICLSYLRKKNTKTKPAKYYKNTLPVEEASVSELSLGIQAVDATSTSSLNRIKNQLLASQRIQ